MSLCIQMADTLSSLRSLMASHSPPLAAFIVPSEDYHQSEYVSDRDKRREFVSGFTGSAGLALITKDEALLWTDGRYFLQAEKELSDQWKLMRIGNDLTFEEWILENLPKDVAIGVDTWSVSVRNAEKWETTFAKKQQKLVGTLTNLVDEVWKSRPAQVVNPVVIRPLEFAGRSVADKLMNLRESLVKEKCQAVVFTALDDVAWLYNIRGSDVSYSPVVISFAIVTLDEAFFYVDKRKVSSEVQDYLKANGIEVRDYADINADIASLAASKLKHSSSEYGEVEAEGDASSDLIWLDPASCCYALYSKLDPNKVKLERSPASLPKALKNPVELEGLRKSHIRDGAAVVQYLVWLDKQMQNIYGASGYFLEGETKKNPERSEKLSELSVSDKLETFRASKELFRGLSFPTISSVGPNAALNHYQPEAETCAELDPDQIYLCDSGAQYLDGTTDVTRTFHFGKASDFEKACYTAVLKGHIDLGLARFPNGTDGCFLDVLARAPLWKDGLDFRHGTGHGIGSYLNVHEGPHSITPRPSRLREPVPLQASMAVTDEPGYYDDGKFGIRIENLLIVKEADTMYNFDDKGYLTFEHVTMVPYQTKMIELSKLTPEEIEFIDSYHSKCRDVLAPYLDETEMLWLRRATEPISA